METTAVVQISDNQNQGYIAGRDLYLGDQYVVQDTLYFEPDLHDLEPPGGVSPAKARELMELLRRQRLIVLGGQGLDEKDMVARHVAQLLAEALYPSPVRVREWCRSSDPQKLETAFLNTEATILLLPQALPHHVGHRLGPLWKLACSRGSFAIVTTDASRSQWRIGREGAEAQAWCELTSADYFGREALADLLIQELAPGEEEDSSMAFARLRDLPLSDLAAQLGHPERVRRFARWLAAQKPPVSPQRVTLELERLTGDRLAVFQDYRQLNRAEQLLALGAALFDGLPDDQVFAALEILVDKAWRSSDPLLAHFDYSDLERLDAHFHLTDAGEDGLRIVVRSPQRRREILAAAWELQRRRLLGTLPAITEMVKGLTGGDPEEAAGPSASLEAAIEQRRARKKKKDEPEPSREKALLAKAKGPEWDLGSTPRRAGQLTRAVVESLSLIGRMSFEAVEVHLLQLATEGRPDLQKIVAKSLAAWRGSEDHERLFGVLSRWWKEGCRPQLGMSLLQRLTRRGREDPRAAVRATVAMTLAYAAQYDRPNEMAPELVALLEPLFQDRHPTVRGQVLETVLPLVAASHLRQLEAFLRARVALDESEMHGVAFGAAMAYSLRPAETVEVLERWQAMAHAAWSGEHSDFVVTARERLLATVALAYGYVRSGREDPLLPPDTILIRLHALLTLEPPHHYVRTAVLIAMGLQAIHGFDLASPWLRQLVSEVSLADRTHLVTIFVRTYLVQRERLGRGDERLEVEGRFYGAWIWSERPHTAIELALCSWLEDGGDPVAQQVAIQTFSAISATALDRAEAELLSRYRSRNGLPHAAGSPFISSLPSARLRSLSRFGQATLLLVAPRAGEVRAALTPLLAEVIATADQSPVAGETERRLLDRLRALPSEAVRSLCRRLGLAILLYRLRWALVVVLLASGTWLWSKIEAAWNEPPTAPAGAAPAAPQPETAPPVR